MADQPRESIVASSLRSFFKTLLGTLGILAAVVIIVVIAGFVMKPPVFPQKSTLTVSPDANGQMELLPFTSPVILRINIHGVIGQGDLTRENFEAMLQSSHDGMLGKDRVKAVVLHIDTPGGVSTDIDTMYRALIAYKKKYQIPVYAFVDGMCASGGMYIGCAADKIYATSSSIIGSIGVRLGPMFNVADFMQRYGVKSMTLTEGKDKDMLNPFRPWQPGEDASLRTIMADMYDQFVAIVISARPRVKKEKLIQDYGAQVYIASDALKIGYIDSSDADYSSVLTELATQAQIPETEAYQVMAIQPYHPLIANLINEKSPIFSGKLIHVFQLHSTFSSELSGKFLYLYQPETQN